MSKYEYDIIVLGPYPNENNIKDGMKQRIAAIDKIMKEKRRLYADISMKKKFFQDDEPVRLDDNLYFVQLNRLKTYKVIFSSKKIYIHSLLNIYKAMPWILFTKAEIFFDMHGIVPEEELFSGRYYKSFVLGLVQKLFFRIKKNINIIYVTQSMRDYMRRKYRFSANDFIVPVFPDNLNNIEIDENKVNGVKEKFRIKDDDVVFIYSGNAQKWQNIDLMLETIKLIATNDRYKFIILTGEYEKFKNLLESYGLKSNENIFLESVLPEELSSYYKLSHYGFLLRDKHVLNNVACPTKAIEYLTYGIIPVVLEENIGDFNSLGYEYIHIDDLKKLNLEPRKSTKNIEIAVSLKETSDIDKLERKLKASC